MSGRQEKRALKTINDESVKFDTKAGSKSAMEHRKGVESVAELLGQMLGDEKKGIFKCGIKPMSEALDKALENAFGKETVTYFKENREAILKQFDESTKVSLGNVVGDQLIKRGKLGKEASQFAHMALDHARSK